MANKVHMLTDTAWADGPITGKKYERFCGSTWDRHCWVEVRLRFRLLFSCGEAEFYGMVREVRGLLGT